jgi:hypothetical protein
LAFLLGSSSSLPGSEPSMSAEESPHDGDNLLGPFLTPSRSAPTLMTDWPKAQINPTVFQGYTSSGMNISMWKSMASPKDFGVSISSEASILMDKYLDSSHFFYLDLLLYGPQPTTPPPRVELASAASGAPADQQGAACLPGTSTGQLRC